jgi:hypothetical protein
MDNIMMDLGEVGWSDEDWIGLAQDGNRILCTVPNRRRAYDVEILLAYGARN